MTGPTASPDRTTAQPSEGGGSIPRRIAARNSSLKIVALIESALEDGKAENIVDIDLAGKTTIADRMVIASGTSPRHVAALADRVVKQMKDAGHRVLGVEGLAQGDWVLVDLGDVIVHLFRSEVRELYNLEKMWSVALPEPMEVRA